MWRKEISHSDCRVRQIFFHSLFCRLRRRCCLALRPVRNVGTVDERNVMSARRPVGITLYHRETHSRSLRHTRARLQHLKSRARGTDASYGWVRTQVHAGNELCTFPNRTVSASSSASFLRKQTGRLSSVAPYLSSLAPRAVNSSDAARAVSFHGHTDSHQLYDSPASRHLLPRRDLLQLFAFLRFHRWGGL